MKKEMFKAIPGFEDYEISSKGKVISFKSGKWKYLKISIDNGGYYQVSIGKIHSLILLTFIGPCPKGMEASHLDGNPLNNKLENLAWETSSQNMQRVNFEYNKGEKNRNAKLTNKDVIQIRKLIKKGVIQIKIAKIFNVSRSCIALIKTGYHWNHI